MAAPEPTPNPRTRNPAPPQDQRPDLRLVPPEIAVKTSGPIPVTPSEPTNAAPAGDELGSDQGRTERPAVTPQAPLDIRLLDAIGGFLRSRPRWSQRPPSLSECWDYSTEGDWTADEKSLRRVLHSLCHLVAFVVTYPIDWASSASKAKPIGFVLTVAVLFILSKVL